MNALSKDLFTSCVKDIIPSAYHDFRFYLLSRHIVVSGFFIAENIDILH